MEMTQTSRPGGVFSGVRNMKLPSMLKIQSRVFLLCVVMVEKMSPFPNYVKLGGGCYLLHMPLGGILVTKYTRRDSIWQIAYKLLSSICYNAIASKQRSDKDPDRGESRMEERRRGMRKREQGGVDSRRILCGDRQGWPIWETKVVTSDSNEALFRTGVVYEAGAVPKAHQEELGS
jgi:hypothetical protein